MAYLHAAFCTVVVVLFLIVPNALIGQAVPAVSGSNLPTQEVSKTQPGTKVAPDTKPIVIADEPKNIDPAGLVFGSLATKVTAVFDEASIREVVEWIQKEASVTVLLDEASLAKVNILPSDPVSEKLVDKPMYLFLERLNSVGLGWFVEDDILHITSATVANEHVTTLTINIGAFFDQGFESDELLETIRSGAGEGWQDWDDGPGTLVLLGDVLFVRQTRDMHRRVDGLLKGLEKHSRQTFVDDPSEHSRIREGLEKKTTVDFDDKPLAEVLVELAEQSGFEIRRDFAAFRANRIREREPISLKLQNQKLTTVLGAIVAKLGMTWTLRNGSILITSKKVAEGLQKTAIYDVRDLCRDGSESDALTDAIMSQIAPNTWMITGQGIGVVVFPKPGMMVVRQTERVHAEILTQLLAYRQALKSSKVREKEDKSKEPLTVFYQMPTPIADELERVLKSMVVPESWKSDQNPTSIGTISKLPSRATLLESKSADKPLVVANSVLIVYQTRENHKLIRKLISNVESGNESAVLGGYGGGGLGGGGFGGGVFAIPNHRERQQK